MLKVVNPVKYTFDEDQLIELIERLNNEKPIEMIIGKQYEKALREYLKRI